MCSAGERNVTGVVQFLKKWLNAIGLVLGMAGVAVVWRFGWPQPSFEDGVSVYVEDGTPLPDGQTARQVVATNRALKARYAIYSRIGLSLNSGGICLPAGPRISGRLIALRGDVAPMLA